MAHSNTNPRSEQYLRHSHSHINGAVAAMESCFGLVRPHQHGIAVGQKIGLKALCTLPFTAEAGAKHPFERQFHTTHVGAGGWEPHGSSPTACAAEGGSALIVDRCASKI